MKKCLIACWYGNTPSYFDIWKKSCSYNLDYDFLLFTDQNLNSDFTNIKINKIDFVELKSLIEKKLNMKVNIDKPYKLCDFRPAFGIIFEDFLVGYDYWGHCDLDQIFGTVSDFLKNEQILKYERINHNGHFVLYKNNEKINNLFKKDGSIFSYSEVFTNCENYAFDEYTGINMISRMNNINELYINDFADIDKRFKRYKTINHSNWKKQIFVLEDGKLNRYVYRNSEIIKQDSFFYLHFQKKNPFIEKQIDYNKKVVIGSCKIGNCDEIDENIFNDFNPPKSTLIEVVELLKYYFIKILEYFKISKKERIIKRKQKGVF